ncbi:RagB/SusD family nutrient uptake outer membrane protein [Marinoscillum pacificum]|uniref:RagB/SusD family nutrient uptake outer membrane protein n=1 Tax=Marinoscillum pacificum TaxID=392723 RepID=UPI002158639C|nr:RagB/SusD family nutrient uptake outer membrane protein [Marinoscillum pacificum]
MKYLNKNTLLIALLFSGFACTDLEEDLNDSLTERQDVNNPGFGASTNVNGSIPNDGLTPAFSTIRNGVAWHGSYFSVSEISTDEAVITQKGGDWFDGGIWLNMHRHDFRSTNPGLNGAWGDIYGGVAQCNNLLGEGGLSDNAVAQLRVLRAYYFWKLMDMFGNIKLTVTAGVDVPQSTRTEAFNFIEAEILAVVDDLGEGRADYGRISQGAAYALLARLYLNAEVYTGTARWQDAIDAADMVINSGNYDLDYTYQEGPDGRMVSAVFSPDNVDNIEHILVAPFDEATGGGMNLAQMTLHYPSQLTYDLQEQPWNGYSTLEEFYNSYDDADMRKDANFIAGPQTDINGNPILDVAFDKADPDGAPINYTPAINELAPNGSRQAGARLGKFSFKLGQINDMDNDYTLLRYGDVLLMKAEALCRRDGNWANAEAISLVNMIRDRAGLDGYTTMTEDTFFAERGREMFQESIRRTDLIRFRRWGNEWWEKDSYAFDYNDYRAIMPIPLDQINASAAGIQLEQNPGYN